MQEQEAPNRRTRRTKFSGKPKHPYKQSFEVTIDIIFQQRHLQKHSRKEIEGRTFAKLPDSIRANLEVMSKENKPAQKNVNIVGLNLPLVLESIDHGAFRLKGQILEAPWNKCIDFHIAIVKAHESRVPIMKYKTFGWKLEDESKSSALIDAIVTNQQEVFTRLKKSSETRNKTVT